MKDKVEKERKVSRLKVKKGGQGREMKETVMKAREGKEKR